MGHKSELEDGPQFKDISVCDSGNGISITVDGSHIKLNYSDALFVAYAITEEIPEDKP